jgi:hypothetical protein
MHDSSRNNGSNGRPVAAQIVSFPPSVQQQLDEAQALLRAQATPVPAAFLGQAGVELAKANPELFLAVVAAQLGVQKVVVEERGDRTRTWHHEKRALGIRYGTEYSVERTSHWNQRTISVHGRVEEPAEEEDEDESVLKRMVRLVVTTKSPVESSIYFLFLVGWLLFMAVKWLWRGCCALYAWTDEMLDIFGIKELRPKRHWSDCRERVVRDRRSP